ncbi:HAMP domain-containing sensor histidine kinase [Stutzerimonas kirkiae]|uniref:HAMP domain-containing sensor histidine kinase n=1 Tax=Stutzerimonas kirkiae TaxID=2211392 RepID=UPI00103840D5|nr:HAMP domain-containing sensor histidine kinase [Stutzerimonas kirkiae]TBV16201.1 PAS domain-containing sensor histidine kinase [Stutzerimonas kirkiae]
MTLRQRIENLPVGRKLLLALLVLLAAVMLISNLMFISAAYWISRQSVAPQAMQTLGSLLSSRELSEKALSSAEQAQQLLAHLEHYAPLRAAIIYDSEGQALAQLQRGERLGLPEHLGQLPAWLQGELRATHLVELPQASGAPGHLLLVASSELPVAFYSGTLTASAGILLFSLLLWILVARQVRRLITQPIRDLESLSHQVTREENYALRASVAIRDEIGRLGEAFNTMLSRMQAREQQLKRARNDAQEAFDRAQGMTEQTRSSNRRLEEQIRVRSQIEHKLTRFQLYLKNIIDSMPSVLITLDENLRVNQWNQEASALSGVPRDQALNRSIFEVFPSLEPFLRQIRRSSQEQLVKRIERVTWMRDQEPHHYTLTLYPLMGDENQAVVIRIDDITQRIAMEEVMVQSEKMLSVGGLAAGMAHEINNPLGAILHNAQNIRRRLSADLEKNHEAAQQAGMTLEAVNQYLRLRQIPELLDGIQQAGSRAAKIVSHMLSFSRMSDRKLAECPLSTLLDQALEIAGNDYDLIEGFDFRAIRIIRDFDGRLERVPCIGNEMEQVLLNLLKNAAQAIHQNCPVGSGQITLRTRLNPPWAEIQVEDNGGGIDESIRKRIFEPFFTTKEVGQGTGLGLSVSYFIVTNNHKGQMEVQSRPGQGSTFTIRLPLSSSADNHGTI